MNVNMVFFIIALFFYIFTTFSLINYLQGFKDSVLRWSNRLLIAGFVSHLLYFVTRWVASGYFPVTTLFEALTFFALTISFFQILIDIKYKVKGIAIFSIILITTLMIVSLFFRFQIAKLPPILNSFWLPAHVFFAFLGNGIFAISFAVSILYLIQLKQVKSKNLSESFFKMPPLETLDALNYKCLTIGFPLLTLGIITGSLWASSAWGSYWSWDPKEVWSLVTWFLYAALLHGRLNSGWRGKRGAIFSIIAFIVVLFTFIGVNTLLPGLHSYANR
jgi:cytochrome c-type biogenesis protein CcsB